MRPSRGAAAAGVERIVCIGDLAELRRGRDRPGASATPACSRRPGCTRTTPPTGATRVRAELAALLERSGGRGGGRVRARLLPRPRAARRRRPAAFAGQVELAETPGKPLVIHTREAADDTLAVLREARCAVVLHCFSLPEHLDEVVERGWYVSFAGNVTYPSASAPGRRGARGAGRAAAARDRLPVPLARAAPRQAQPPRATCSTRWPSWPSVRGSRAGAGRAGGGATPPASSPCRERARGQVTLARLAELGLRPDTSLGQHFLVDDNLLGVIERLAALEPGDVALEIGAGRGHAHGAPGRALAHVHAVEIDRRLEPALSAHASRASTT